MSTATVAAVRLAVDEVEEAVTTLTAGEWERPSRCGGWRVQDLVAHMSSNWKEVVDPTPPPDPPRLPAETLMELLVEPRRAWTAGEVLAEHLACCDPAVDVLAALHDEPMASTLQPLADLGAYPLHQLADAFAFDHYCHPRIDLLAPEGTVERTVAPTDAARLGPAIGWMVARPPKVQADLADHVEPTAPLRLTLIGPGGGSWVVANHDGAVSVGPDGAGEVVEITSDAHAFVSWGTCRTPLRQDCCCRATTRWPPGSSTRSTSCDCP